MKITIDPILGAALQIEEPEVDGFLELFSEINPAAVFPTEFKNAIVGYIERPGQSTVLLLDRDECIRIFMEEQGAEYLDAVEWVEDTMSAYMGENTPFYATFISRML